MPRGRGDLPAISRRSRGDLASGAPAHGNRAVMRTILLVLAVLLIACGGGPPAPAAPDPGAGQAAKPPAKPSPAKPSFPGAPATATGDALAWVLDAIVKRQGKVERAELEAHFDASFLAKVPVEQAQKIFG